MSKKATSSSGRSKTLAASAARVLKDSSASRSGKTLAAAALAKSASTSNVTSKQVALQAAKLLRDPRASKDVKAVAASALTQRPPFKADVDTRKIYDSVRDYYAKQSLTKSR